MKITDIEWENGKAYVENTTTGEAWTVWKVHNNKLIGVVQGSGKMEITQFFDLPTLCTLEFTELYLPDEGKW